MFAAISAPQGSHFHELFFPYAVLRIDINFFLRIGQRTATTAPAAAIQEPVCVEMICELSREIHSYCRPRNRALTFARLRDFFRQLVD